jgi:hypothetical protein
MRVELLPVEWGARTHPEGAPVLRGGGKGEATSATERAVGAQQVDGRPADQVG